MNIAGLFSGSRSLKNLVSRMGTILSRFGLTSGKFAAILNTYSTIMRQTGCTATLPITAKILKRHPDLVRSFNGQGIEFAIHGYVHVDYRQLSGQEQLDDYKKAMETFEKCRVPFTGYRAPFLRFNQATPWALSSLRFAYDSSDSLYWDSLNESAYPASGWKMYLRLLDYYQSGNAENSVSLPRDTGQNGMVEIPVSLPDDEAMIERLAISNSEDVARIWSDILERTYRRGELFTLSLHPERIGICGEALRQVVLKAQSDRPAVWIATLREIAEWWREKARCGLFIEDKGNSRYAIHASGPAKATLLVRNCRTSCAASAWYGKYKVLSERKFDLESPQPPVIGLALNTSPAAAGFLQKEGYPIEVSSHPEKYGLYFDNLSNFKSTDEKKLSDAIESSESPLVRFWRWPDGARSALSVTGDIDSITLWDFALRLIEARQQKRRQKYQVEVASAGATN